MGKKKIISEVWDSMNYMMPNTGYVARAQVNGVVDANGGELPRLSFSKLIENLGSYFVFGGVKGEGLNDRYVSGEGKVSGLAIEIFDEVNSDLTKRLDVGERDRLLEIISGRIPDENGSKLTEIGGHSIPLLSAKFSYLIVNSNSELKIVRRVLLNSGLERV